jgi:hypothetical protein
VIETRTGCTSGEDDVRDLDDTCGSGCSNLNNRLGVVVVEEEVSGAHDLRPGFTDDLSAGGDRDCAGDDIGSGREVNDLTSSVLKAVYKYQTATQS